jgi:protein gp37
MDDKSKIEWTDATWNCIRGCSRVSTGCERCYAEGVAARFSGPGQPYEGLALRKASGPAWTGEVRFVPEHLGDPLRWQRPRRVFVNSMSDLFHEKVTNEQIAAIFGVMAASPQHTFQVLTKRPERMVEWFKWVASRELPLRTLKHSPMIVCALEAQEILGAQWTTKLPRLWPLPNVWMGVSCENQKAANERVPLLLQTPAAVRFVSAEPLLGPIDFTRPAEIEERALDWVIVGGESGPGARPCDVAWIRSIAEQCQEAGTACFVKQLGAKPVRDVVPTGNFRTHDGRRQYEMTGERIELRDRKGGDMDEWPEDLRVRQFPQEGKVA